jgi:hypothetical protein
MTFMVDRHWRVIFIGTQSKIPNGKYNRKQLLTMLTFRICALKKVYNDGGTGENWEEWWRTVEDTWATVVGIVSWEFERYSACCLRSE